MISMSTLSEPRLAKRLLMGTVSAPLIIALAACSASDDVAALETDASAETVETVSSETEVALEGMDMTDNTATIAGADEDEVRQAGSHVHGKANLALALDDQTLAVELESPLYNLIGFEHAPETDEQVAAVENAESLLSNPSTLFIFNPEAGCTAGSMDAVELFSDTASHEAGHDSDHDDHDHGEAHDHGHDDDEHDHEHDDAHDHSDKHDHSHKDALLNYSFTCSNADALQWMQTGLFASFSNLTNVDLVYLGPDTQMSDTYLKNPGRISLVD